MNSAKKILIVDDNEEFCENLSDILELEGYGTKCAFDGFQALEKVKQYNFDVVLMDVKMPTMDGVMTFKKLRLIAPQIPVIILTAFAVEDLIKDALNNGAFGFLKKPVDFKRLFDLIENATPNGGLIMVVDDEEEMCANLRDILTEKHFRVTTALDGEKAVEMAKEKDFDIIILDLNLPKLNGLETYLRIREFRPKVVTVAITGHGKELGGMARKIVEKNAYTCLEKPLDMEEFLVLLNDILQKKEEGILIKP